MLLNDDDEDVHTTAMAMTTKTSLPLLPTVMMAEKTAKMTMAMIPSTMMGTRGRNDERRYKRKDNFRTMMTMLTTL